MKLPQNSNEIRLMNNTRKRSKTIFHKNSL